MIKRTYDTQLGVRSTRELSSRVSDLWYAGSVAWLATIDKAQTVNTKVSIPTECIESITERETAGAFSLAGTPVYADSERPQKAY